MPEASGFGTKTRIGFDIDSSARMSSNSAFDSENDSESMVSTKYTIPSDLGSKWRKERRAAHKVLFREER
jgi:hypothetical protein